MARTEPRVYRGRSRNSWRRRLASHSLDETVVYREFLLCCGAYAARLLLALPTIAVSHPEEAFLGDVFCIHSFMGSATPALDVACFD